MKLKLTFRLVLALLFCSFYTLLVAQTDSSWLDLGRIKLKKDFTQTVTIKGKDLEQMPFNNLSDALSVWLNGLATHKTTLVYVIDGHLLADVNAYSIYDIEEITLVQNALVQLNGAPREKQLVLITTRKPKEKQQGLTIAGNAFAVTNSFRTLLDDAQKSETNFYHQYYVSAYQNRKHVQYGISAGYHREVLPYPDTGYVIRKPLQINRWRLNGYLNAALNANNQVWVRAGYVPSTQVSDYKMGKNGPDAQGKEKEPYFTIEAGWQSRLFKGFTNELSAGYIPATIRTNSKSLSYNFNIPGQLEERYYYQKETWSNLLITDQLSYHTARGNWTIDPSVNFSFRSLRIANRTESTTINSSTGFTVRDQTNYDADYKVFLLTPAVNIGYKNSVQVQGGFVYNLSEQTDADPKSRKLLPFVTMAVDVLKLKDRDSRIAWKLYGSWAAAGNFGDDVYRLNEFVNYFNYPYPRSHTRYSNGGFYRPVSYGGDTTSYMLQAGTTVSAWGNRLQAGYSFEKRKYGDIVSMDGGNPAPVLVRMDIVQNTHRLGVMAKVLESKSISWSTGLNVSALKTTFDYRWSGGPFFPIIVSKAKPLWTGGWVNRLQYKQFMAGLDLLYEFNLIEYTSGSDVDDDKEFSLRNIYAGYQFIWKNKPLDVYASCRNPGQKNDNNLPDRRNYFGVGFKATL
jgi:hypothetical protein